MRTRRDGSIQSSNTPTDQNIGRIYDSNLYRCMVTKTVFVDSSNLSQNSGNPRVLYDVVVLGGNAGGQIITDCRLASDLGGNDNYHEIVLKATTKSLDTDPLSQHDGDAVFLYFIQGDTDFPVIMMCDQGFLTSKAIGATLEDGIREIRQFNGVKSETNKKGEITLTRQGGTVVDGVFVPNEGIPDYKLETKDPELQIETFKSGIVRKVDGVADRVTLTLKSGTLLDIDGAKGKVILSADFVDLGNAVSDLVLLASELVSAFSAHTHSSPQSPSGVLETLPPSAPLPASVMSSTVNVQK